MRAVPSVGKKGSPKPVMLACGAVSSSSLGRFLVFQKDSALARWYVGRTSGPNGARRTTMIVALARKLLIALWRLATTGVVPEGVVLRPAG